MRRKTECFDSEIVRYRDLLKRIYVMDVNFLCFFIFRISMKSIKSFKICFCIFASSIYDVNVKL